MLPQSLHSSLRRGGARRVCAALAALALVAGLAAAFVATRSEASVGGRARQADAKKKAKPDATKQRAQKSEPAAPPVDAPRRPGTARQLPPQDATPASGQMVVRSASRFDVSPPLREMTPNLSVSDDGEGKGLDDRGPGGPVGNTAHTPDPVLQPSTRVSELAPPGPAFEITELDSEAPGVASEADGEITPQTEIAAPDRSFAGLFNPPGPTGPVPPDPIGDIGPNHYVQMVNSRFQIFTRDGTSVFGPANINTLFAGFGGPCQTENAGDPVAIYDEIADRWLLLQFTSAGPTYFNCLAVSTTGDPTGSYYRYAISTGANFPDYPKMAAWHDAYYISTREFLNGAVFAGVGAYAIDRVKATRGDPTAMVISTLVAPLPAPLPNPIPPTGPQPMYRIGDGLLPSDLDGHRLPPAGQPNFFVGSMDNGGPYGAPQDALNVFEFHVDFVTPANSTFIFKGEVPIAPYDTIFPCSGGATPSRNCIPQPDTTVRIDILSYRQRPLHRLAYRNFGTHESLVTNQAVEAAPGIAGTRWWELRNPHTTPTIFQEGTYAPGVTDSIHRWMGSASMDHEGNIGLSYSVSAAATVYPGIRYTGRLVTDPLGTMPQGEGILVNGGGSQTSTSSRWGDYSSLNVDPNNDCHLWITNEYYATTSARGWSTRIGSFRFAECLALPSVSVVAPGQLIISEFRLRGPSGTMDEYVELYNPAEAALTVKSADGTGLALVSSDAPTLAKCVVPEGTVVPARGHYLCANTASPSPGAPPAYSLSAYPAGNGTTATPDNNILSDIPDTAGLALFRTTTAANFVAANVLDAVGPATLPGGSPFLEGTGLAPAPTTDIQYAYFRALYTGRPQDTGVNSADFILVSTDGSAGRLGAPGPENTTSPVMRSAATEIRSTLIAPCLASSQAPNRERVGAPGGTLKIRRNFTNTTGAPVTRLRFRIIDITAGPAPAGTADLRVVTSTDDAFANPCGVVASQGLTLEEPPAQPNGGGWNSTVSAGTVTLATPLADGATIPVNFLSNVMQSGSFRFLVMIEA
ncbi:MAG TPA: hypothetical protein VGV38_03415, partial [Pyrinomonadaceae bacterium]|nr:hypothetical protein [Pyrinomonadaceae bacterium]